MSHRYCYKDFVKVHQKTKGEHNEIDIATRRQEIKQKFVSTIENLDKVKREVISRSNELFRFIQIVKKSTLDIIQNYIDSCYKNLNSAELDTEKIFKDFQNIKLQESDLESFTQIAAKNFSILQNDNEIMDFELQKVLVDIKRKSLRFSKTLQETNKKLQSNLSLYLQGHTFTVNSVAVTSDNKYILSGSDDHSIRIWNLLKKLQKTALRGHSGWVYSIALTSDNKYVVSGSWDKTIRIWNFWMKLKKLFCKDILLL